MPEHHADHVGTSDGSGPPHTFDVGELVETVRALEAQADHLRDAAETRQRIGFVCGVLAERYGLSAEVAWTLLTRLSQATNIKVRDIARVVHADLDGGIGRDDADLAARLNSQVEGTVPLLSTPPPVEPST